ncbi:MAG: hypothetical protein AAGA45_04905 [Verrucomicrobiota bacterium]
MRQQQLLRQAILLQLEASLPNSLPLTTIRQGVTLAGLKSGEKTLLKELSYLNDKGMIETLVPDLDAADKRYRLTASGQDYLEGAGLV